MKTFKTILTSTIIFLLGIIIIAICLAFPIMWLWNWLMPLIFGLIGINFWQALGIGILSGILFKSNSSSK